MQQRLKLFSRVGEWTIPCLIIAGAVWLGIWLWPEPPSPVPSYIRQQVGFSVLYPKGYTIPADSWKYYSTSKNLNFTAKKNNVSVVFTEQKTPLAYQNDVAAYSRFIGSLHPRANFEVPLGTVSIVNFITAGDYQVVGESGVLNAKNTLVIVHPDVRQPNDDEWRSIFVSLSVASKP